MLNISEFTEILKSSIAVILMDSTLFIVFESMLFIVFIFALYTDLFKLKTAGIVINRGEESVKKIFSFPSLIIAFGLIDLTINVAGNYKIFFVLFNSIILVYLSFFSSWGRNLIIGFYNRIEAVKEKH